VTDGEDLPERLTPDDVGLEIDQIRTEAVAESG
jgi:hypothetical protein